MVVSNKLKLIDCAIFCIFQSFLLSVRAIFFQNKDFEKCSYEDYTKTYTNQLETGNVILSGIKRPKLKQNKTINTIGQIYMMNYNR